MIKVLGFPTRHPYTSKFHEQDGITFVNPNTDYFNGYGGEANSNWINTIHPPESYDLVHIHFSFDKLDVDSLKLLLDYFKSIKKPIVWTCHSRESQRKRNLGNGELQKMLFEYSSAIIAPTLGCKKWLNETFGNSKDIEIIPLGYMVGPDSVMNFWKTSAKSRDNFVYLVGDLRENKEVNQSIINFLQCTQLQNCILTVIVKPLSIYANSFKSQSERIILFWNIISSSQRIKIISLPEISNDLITNIFCCSHVCLLPYLWGTHSGQVELARDCGCYPVISNVGYYLEQSNQVIEFEYSDIPVVFASNFTTALVEAQSKPLLIPDFEFRSMEFRSIIDKHKSVYNSVLNLNNS